MSDRYDPDDEMQTDGIPCPACGNPETRSQRCRECEDGFNDVYDDDPINESPGTLIPCPECKGETICRWCPKCGADYWLAKRSREAKRRACHRASPAG